MKKPVMAIDIRRTATVLDFAVGGSQQMVAQYLGGWNVPFFAIL